MLERVTATVRRHGLVEPGQHVVVAVSGGADSVCLLHALHMLRRLLRIRVSVVHVDHRQRPESELDAAYVRRMADRLKLESRIYRLEAELPPGASPEAWLREQRYLLFRHAMRDAEADRVATGHTADDQAETVLMRLIRGAALEGLAGIPPRRDAYIRPLLEVRRSETEAFVRALGLRPRRDPTNEDRRFLRNVIRLDVLPAIERSTGREVRGAIARTAEAVRADVAFLEDAAEREERAIVRPRADGSVVLQAAALARLPYPVGSRVVARALVGLGLPGDQARAHVDAVLDLARGRRGREAMLPRGLNARREATYVRLARPSPSVAGPG